jgi:hypothetical protein
LADGERETDTGDLFADLEYLTDNMHSYPTGENLEHAKVRTVVMDFLGEKRDTDWATEFKNVYHSCQVTPSVEYRDNVIWSSSTDDSDKFSNSRVANTKKEAYLRVISDWTRCRVLCRTEGDLWG